MRILYSLILFVFAFSQVQAQCGPGVPAFNVNLTGNPDSTWTSPMIARNGNCCGTTPPDKCINFIITLDPGAAGISFDIVAGAIPGGALFYQIGCGPPQALGTAICLSGPGPHLLTFCKPGNNANVYQITSIPAAVGGSNVVVNQGCTDTLVATGFTPSSITWNSIAPGAPGAYNSLLSCTTGCTSPIVTGTATAPPFVDYVVCGVPEANCTFSTVCDTVRVTFNPTLAVSIVPINPTICFGATSTTITAVGSGGTTPYSYLWNSINPSPSISVGAGNYTVMLSDASGCAPVYASVTVTSFAVAITANAGPNDTVCITSPVAQLAGSVTGASGGIWSGGGGTFSPNNTTLNATYSPSAAELAAGFVDLTLTTTGNGTCPAATDVVRIYFLGFLGTVSTAVTNVTCFGANNGTATVAVTGGIPPFTYSWNTVPAQTGATATGLAPGTYTVTIQNGIGCTATATATVTQPLPLAQSGVVTNVSCNGGSNGSVAITASGGTAPYSYLWSPGGATTATLSGRPAGTYTVTITDNNGCVLTANYTITQPPLLTASTTVTNVSCAGGANGTATVTVGGGTAPYTYAWTPSGSTAATATGLPAGTYTVSVTDAKGCIVTATAVITQPPILSATTSSTPETCSYLNNGGASVVAAGGTAPYAYLWSGGQTTSSISGQAAGTYTVTVTDFAGCTVTVFATIIEPPALVLSTSGTPVNCFGGSDGVAQVAVTGGTPGYTYSWAPSGGTASVATGLAAGTYTVTVTDANTCTATATFIVTQPAAPLSTTAVIDDANCFGASDGGIAVTAAGGTGPYTYQWLPGGQTSSAISGQPAGTYTINVTDANGCTVSAPYTIAQPTALAVTFNSTTVSCFGGSDGTATAVVTGGTSPYTYLWSVGGITTATASGLSQGTYSVTVTDANMCTITASVTITEPTVLYSSATTTDETCDYLNNGTATVTAGGGTAPYTYLWSPSGGTAATATGLSAGTYTVTVTDAEGCISTATATINQPSPIVIVFDTQINVSCFGGADGVLSATVSGGTPGYTFAWSSSTSTSNVASGLSAGVHTVTITDNNSCVATASTTITEPAAPLAVSTSSLPATCFGATNGSISATATGGTAPYSYEWMPGSLTGSSVSGMSSGTYTVNVEDANGCLATNTVFVSQPTEIIPVTSTVNSNCGTASGSASVTVSGGNPPYTYLWSPTGGTGSTADSLLAGPYTVTVTDASGCTASMWANINDNAGPVATIFDIVNVTCNGGNDGAASVGVAGGTGPFLYEWTPYGGTGPTATGLVAGTYTVTVTDNNGCISNATTSPDILEPPPIVIDFSTTDVLCFGGSDGSVETTVTGGTPGYTYSWSPGGATTSDVTGLAAGTYTLTVTDLNLCVTSDVVTVTQPATAVTVSAVATPVSCSGGSDGTVSALASGGNPPFIYSWSPGGFSGSSAGSLTAGSYTVTATDLNGCVATATAVVTQPAPLALVTGSNNASCGGPTGLAFVTTSGGTTPYSYFWTPGGSTNDTASSLMPGTYTVSVTDNNSCNTTATVVVNNNPGPSVAITDVTNVSCFGGTDGTVTATVTGGAAPFIYSWAPAGGSGPVATGLSAGSYTVTVIDQNGCEASVITFPGVTQPPPIVLTITSDDVSCTAGSDGTASVTGSGGTPPFSYVWMPSLATGSSISGLAPGTYTVQATDANNCTQQNTFVIGEPAPLAASISSSIPVSCFGGSNGSATAAGSGGTLPYSYNWLPYGGTAATATGLAAGSYTVTITDAQGCTSTAIASITEPVSALSASATGSSTSCAAGSDATATVFPSGGTPGYTYLWTPTGQTASTATGLSAGIYNVLVTDANGCQTNASATITQPPGITATLTTVNPSCGFSNGSITTAVSGGTGAYSYLWSPGGATSANVTGLAPGTYTVTITDAEGCSSPFTAVLTNIPGPSVAISSSVPVSCNGGNDGFATVSISAGTTPYTMIWLPYGGTAATATGLVAGSYTVTVTDGLGCESSAVANITEPSLVSLSIASSSNVLCSAGASGNATVSASGGTPPYLYSWSTGATGATVSGLAAGTYTATATDANNCSSSISVVIDEPDSLMASMTSIITPSCFNSTNGSITASVTGGTIPYSFLWSDGQTGSTATGLAAGSYSVAVTDANGCTTSASFVLTQPTQIITIAGGNDTICLGSSGTLTATATGGSGGYYYAWQPGSVINSGTFNVNPPSNTTYTVVAYDADGCAGTPDTVSAIVYNLTEANIQALALSPICPGQSTVVYAEAYGSTGPLTYSWNNGLGSGPGGFLVTPSTEITYVVTVTNACGASIQDSVSITFNPPPAIAMSSDTNSVCAPGTIQFYDSSSTGNISDPITSWLWNFGDGTTSTLQNPEHTYSSPGIYGVTLTVTTLGGCNNTNSSTPYIVQVHPYPTAAFTVSSSTLNLPYDALVTTNLSTGATTYYWDFGDGSSSTSTNPVHNYNAVGIYPVTLIATSAYGCSDTAYTTITTTADVVFPNVFTPGGNGPTDGGYDPNSFDNDVFFPYTSGVVKFRLEIYNRWGELIFVSTDIRKGWDGYYKGELCQQDVYVWKADIELNDGKTFNKSGDVTLLR